MKKMVEINEITKKLQQLPYHEQVVVCEFIDFLDYRTRHSMAYREMNDAEILIAAEQTGSFDFLDDPSEDIYSLTDGSPL